LELHSLDPQSYMTEDSVDQMLSLAERLRASNGGVLDDSAIQAVAEATGAPAEYVRLLVKIKTEKEGTSFLTNLRSQFLTLDVQTRRYVIAGFAAAMCAFFIAASMKVGELHSVFASEFLQIIALVWITLGLYNSCTAREGRTAAVVGALFTGGAFTAYEVFGFVFRLNAGDAPFAFVLVPCVLLGAVVGVSLNRLTDRFRGELGLKDPVTERQELLRQLQDLQTKLKSGEQLVTFLSVDIVGSTRMKSLADPLSVEFTFNEYHQFVDRIVKKHTGRVHSTAGDGVTCAFESAIHAFAAARNISVGLLELNMLRNKIGSPIVLRQAIHTGMVIPPEGGDIRTVNFAHVIDVSAHLQKEAPPGSVVVSDESAQYIPGGPTMIGVMRVQAAGVEGTVWMPKSPAARPQGAPPPLPDLAHPGN
jgi:class 3 adenylate cyclase